MGLNKNFHPNLNVLENSVHQEENLSPQAHEQTNHELRCQLEVKAAMERNAREELEAMQRDLAEAVSDAEVAREEGRRLEAQLRAELHREMLKVMTLL